VQSNPSHRSHLRTITTALFVTVLWRSSWIWSARASSTRTTDSVRHSVHDGRPLRLTLRRSTEKRSERLIPSISGDADRDLLISGLIYRSRTGSRGPLNPTSEGRVGAWHHVVSVIVVVVLVVDRVDAVVDCDQIVTQFENSAAVRRLEIFGSQRLGRRTR
jgi:hypothetical protein